MTDPLNHAKIKYTLLLVALCALIYLPFVLIGYLGLLAVVPTFLAVPLYSALAASRPRTVAASVLALSGLMCLLCHSILPFIAAAFILGIAITTGYFIAKDAKIQNVILYAFYAVILLLALLFLSIKLIYDKDVTALALERLPDLIPEAVRKEWYQLILLIDYSFGSNVTNESYNAYVQTISAHSLEQLSSAVKPILDEALRSFGVVFIVSASALVCIANALLARLLCAIRLPDNIAEKFGVRRYANNTPPVWEWYLPALPSRVMALVFALSLIAYLFGVQYAAIPLALLGIVFSIIGFSFELFIIKLSVRNKGASIFMLVLLLMFFSIWIFIVLGLADSLTQLRSKYKKYIDSQNGN